jgi:1-acyl-sn-glycerol-3-phosphate acyltransferase
MRALVTLGRVSVVLITGFVFSLVAILSILFEKNGRWYFWSGATWSKISLKVCGVSVRVRGMENINQAESYIYVTNHASLFDIPSIMATLPQVRIMFKKELSYIPVWGWSLRWGHHIMVDRAKGSDALKSLDRAAKAMRTGGSVILFAEGTRSPDGKMLPFKRGAFSLAAKSEVPIVPITINGSFKILPKHSLNINPSTIELVIEKPIQTRGILTREEEIALMNQVRKIISGNYKEEI